MDSLTFRVRREADGACTLISKPNIADVDMSENSDNVQTNDSNKSTHQHVNKLIIPRPKRPRSPTSRNSHTNNTNNNNHSNHNQTDNHTNYSHSNSSNIDINNNNNDDGELTLSKLSEDLGSLKSLVYRHMNFEALLDRERQQRMALEQKIQSLSSNLHSLRNEFSVKLNELSLSVNHLSNSHDPDVFNQIKNVSSQLMAYMAKLHNLPAPPRRRDYTYPEVNFDAPFNAYNNNNATNPNHNPSASTQEYAPSSNGTDSKTQINNPSTAPVPAPSPSPTSAPSSTSTFSSGALNKPRGTINRWTPEEDRSMDEMVERGLSHQEIADTLGRSIRSIQTRLHLKKKRDQQDSNDDDYNDNDPDFEESGQGQGHGQVHRNRNSSNGSGPSGSSYENAILQAANAASQL